MNILKKLFNRIKSIFSDESGLSLLELMIVIVIIGIIAITVGPKLFSLPQKARVTKAKESISTLSLTLDSYNLDNGFYPSTEQGLIALIEAPTDEPVPQNYQFGGYLKGKKVPKDPWGNDFIYESDGSSYKITSLGADGQEGGEQYNADISSEE